MCKFYEHTHPKEREECITGTHTYIYMYIVTNMTIGFTLDLKDLQVTVFAEKALLMSYTSFRYLSTHDGHCF